ncbi:hypothetical protein BCCGELA001_30365 [Bradyrhizobium sp. CCGE-LA001]|nr:hypothetical protein BCCGELA001_30365 [Bradyrhizobium sp. CCGE-LA001]
MLIVVLQNLSLDGVGMKSRAAVDWEAKRPLSIESIEIGGPRPGEVLVEIKATGVCHTDAYTLSGLALKVNFRRSSATRARESCAKLAKV